MESGRVVPRRRKVGVLFMLLGLLTGTFNVFGPRADAAPVTAGVIGNFEIDGDQTSPPGGTIDWGDVDPTVLTDAINPDDGLQGSSKEDEPEGFACQDKSPTVTPGKDNLVRAYINTRVAAADSIFLDLGFVRSDGGTQGDSHVNFEFNQNPITGLCPYLTRTDGDLLITFDFPGNAADPADVQTFSWDSDAPDGSDEPGRWIPFTFTGSVAAEDNIAEITDQVVGGTIAPRAFGEASIDLVALAEATGGGDGECASFGFASIRSRSSGQSFESALQDIMGGPVDVTTCGKVVVHKTDDAGTALAGATFGLWPAAETVPPVGVDGTRPSTGSVDTCTSIANGTCTFDSVNPGDYQVAELTAPDGYAIDPDVVDVTVGFRETVDVAAAFVDPLDTGFVEVTKAVTDAGEPFAIDPADLLGLTFILEQGGVQVNTWPPPGSPAECSLDGITLSCTIGPVPLGDYVITEDPATLPDGMNQGDDVNVTIDEDGETVDATLTNPLNPIDINLEKAGPDTANVGDVITYTFDVTTTGEPLTITQLVELVELPTYDDRCDFAPLTGPDKSTTIDADNNGDALLEAGETWRWTCQHTVTLADATDTDGALLQNKAEVTGEDSFGRDVSDDDTHTVTILLPDISIAKTPDGATVFPGDVATYTIVVSNAGPGRANDVTLSDDLLDGIDWAVGGADGADCSITPDVGTVGQQLTCDFGDINAGDSRTITVSGTTATADCGLLPNTASADASNDDEVSDSGEITVSCADVTVDKTPDGGEVSAGDDAAFTIVVTNLSATTNATGVLLSDDLPDGIDWAVGGVDAASCDITPDVGTTGQVLTCDFGTLAPSATRTVTVSGATDAPDCGLLPNTATVSSTNEAVGADDNNSDDGDITVLCPNIDITKVADADVVDAGDDIGFTIEVTNAGPGQAKDVTISDPLPAGDGVVWTVDPAVEGCTILLGTLLCQVGDLDAEGSFSVHVTGTTPGTIGDPNLPAACKVYDNTATASASNDDDETASDSTEVLCPLDITIEKDGPALAHRGDEITYTFTVTNSGEADLVEVVLTDPICDEGTLELVDDADGDTTLAIGEEWTYECTRVITATDPDPLPNTATVVGTDVRDRTTDDTDDHLVDLIAPAIQVVKTVDNATPGVGQTVTFTYVVTNTGDTTLFNVAVVDDQLGPIGTIAELAAGASATLTKTMVVAADSPALNIATATGADVLGKTVTDDDPETITIVLGEVIVKPAPAQLPRTGAESRQLLLLSGLLLVLGGLMVASGQSWTLRTARRRQS